MNTFELEHVTIAAKLWFLGLEAVRVIDGTDPAHYRPVWVHLLKGRNCSVKSTALQALQAGDTAPFLAGLTKGQQRSIRVSQKAYEKCGGLFATEPKNKSQPRLKHESLIYVPEGLITSFFWLSVATTAHGATQIQWFRPGCRLYAHFEDAHDGYAHSETRKVIQRYDPCATGLLHAPAGLLEVSPAFQPARVIPTPKKRSYFEL